jgi:hypothetical protein
MRHARLNEYVIDTIESGQLVLESQLIQSINLRTIKQQDIRLMRSFCQFHVDNACIISGLCFWFDCYFSSNNNSSILRSTRLTTSPYASKTHWKQTLVFLRDDIYPLKGDILPVNITLRQLLHNRQHYQLTISIKKCKQRSMHNTIINDNSLHCDRRIRKRERRRSSTISFDRRTTCDSRSLNMSRENTSSSNSDDNIETNEHSIPCSCDRDRCQLIKIILEKYTKNDIVV